jgi:molybdenum cofactor guanylyltransferase
MGRDKAFIKINGEALIERQLRLLNGVFRNIIIVTNSPQVYQRSVGVHSVVDRMNSPRKYAGFKSVNPVRKVFSNGIRTVCDVIPGMGPLGGIYSGLLASGSFYNFVIACDMPFINKSLAGYMIKNKRGHDVVIPKIAGRIHPLFGVYSKTCVPAIEEMLKRSRLKVAGIFAKVRTRFISRQEIEKFDKNILTLLNINTPDELRRLKLNGGKIRYDRPGIHRNKVRRLFA